MAIRPIDRRALGWLAAAHVVNDMNQGAVPALLPFLIAERGLTYAAAGGVVLAATLLSSLVQPVLGHLSDRRPLPFLMPLAVLAAGCGLALAGAVTGYGATIAAILLSGAGVAAFHPESARYANYASGERRATGMSVFSVGGNLGIALGPVAIALLAGSGGVARIVWMALPAGIMAALLARELPRLRVLRPETSRSCARGDAGRAAMGSVHAALRRHRGSLALRLRARFLRSSLSREGPRDSEGAGRSRRDRDASRRRGRDAGGRPARGPLRPPRGPRRALSSRWLRSSPFFSTRPGIAGLVTLVLIGGCTVATYSVAVVMGQEYLPGREGIAGGVTMGLAIGVGGAGVPLLGALADHQGVASVFPVLAALPLVAAALSLTLPGPQPALKREVPNAA